MVTVLYLSVIKTNGTILVKIYLALIFRGIRRNKSIHHLKIEYLFMAVQSRFKSKMAAVRRVYCVTCNNSCLNFCRRHFCRMTLEVSIKHNSNNDDNNNNQKIILIISLHTNLKCVSTFT